MTLFNIGRLCVKLAGRDAGRKCVVVEQVDNTLVVIDGDVRRKKVNMKHLEPLADVIEIKDKASHEDVASAFKKLGLGVWEKKSKQVAERPKKQKVKKVKPVNEKKSATKKESKTEKEVEEKQEVKEASKLEETRSVEESKPEEKTEVKKVIEETTEKKE